MKCRHCGEALDKGASVCPDCGKSNFKQWQVIVAIAAAVIVLAGLAVVLFMGLDLEFLKKKDEPTTPTATEDTAHEHPVEKYDSSVDYSGSQEEAEAALDTVVATVNGQELTNRELQMYFNLEVSNFINANGSYLTQLGFDYTRPLNEQQCYGQEMSWEAYFVQEAINTWKQYQLIYAQATEEGFEVSDEMKKTLAEMPGMLEGYAAADDCETVDEWLEKAMFARITADDYLKYCNLIAVFTEYLSQEPTDEEVESYFTENISHFEELGITKDSGVIADVRHILICPIGDSEDQKEFTEEQWQICYEEAERILEEWKAGAATEESFAELANKYSQDGGSNTTGGLYQGITPESSYVEPFLNWSVDESRQVGDTGIVETEFGYHIMYYSAGQGQWEYYARQWFLEDRQTKLLAEAAEKWSIEIVDDAICIQEFPFA